MGYTCISTFPSSLLSPPRFHFFSPSVFLICLLSESLGVGGFPVDPKEAVKWYKKAAEKGNTSK
jgi:hypothetical protein